MRNADTGRRLAAVAILVASVAALVATSPGGPPVTPLTAQTTSVVELTADAPVASVRMTIEVSDEALWSDDPEIQTGKADLRVTARARWPEQSDAERVTYFDIPTVNLRIVDADGRPQASETVLFDSERVDLLAACTPDLDCVVEVEAVVEWVDARPGVSAKVELMAVTEVAITGPEEPPVGATVALRLADPVATDAVVRSDRAEGSALLDVDHPVATWTVRATADAGAIPGTVAWPTDGRMTFVSRIQVTGGSDEDRRPGSTRPIQVHVFDETGAELTGSVRRFDAFAACEAERPCEVDVTVVARWLGTRGDERVTLDWRLDGGLVYHGADRPTEDAAVDLVVARQSVAGGDGPTLEASGEGELTFDTAQGGLRTSRAIRLDVPVEAMDPELLGGPIPALTGVLTVSGRTSDQALDGLRPLIIRWEPGTTTRAGSFALDPVPNGEAVSAFVDPGPDCRAGRACRVTFELGAGIVANDVERLAGQTVTVRWRLDVTLHYPDGTRLPDRLAIELSDDAP